jgi:hypothetical protein
MLPFQADFRTSSIPDGNKLKNQFKQRMRKRLRDAMQDKNPEVYRNTRSFVRDAINAYTKLSEKASHAAGKAIIESTFYGLYPEAVLPVGMAQLSVDMIRNPKKYNDILGGAALSGAALSFYMMRKGIVPP